MMKFWYQGDENICNKFAAIEFFGSMQQNVLTLPEVCYDYPRFLKWTSKDLSDGGFMPNVIPNHPIEQEISFGNY